MWYLYKGYGFGTELLHFHTSILIPKHCLRDNWDRRVTKIQHEVDSYWKNPSNQPNLLVIHTQTRMEIIYQANSYSYDPCSELNHFSHTVGLLVIDYTGYHQLELLVSHFYPHKYVSLGDGSLRVSKLTTLETLVYVIIVVSHLRRSNLERYKSLVALHLFQFYLFLRTQN